ncbi:protein translocase subunit SecD [Trichothermofontia sichuanensis B231]|uniref:protein translocase subunit SecD n=1 Tax=Trichothermofontia sichuanensis TaxID=3045816 RepID=UPI00224785CD|nr:protein translocase subunit SecD [Trichothermofontia sichuanensis]UZQ54137.1 protein translocase subunit SecD [Trichothermofontia sichuanensis B231]
MQKQRLMLIFVTLLTIAALLVIVRFPTRLGLDLQGGAQLLIQVKPSEEITQVGERELAAVKAVLENRVNGLGVSEPIVQTVGTDQISVQLPGVSDPQQAERVLGGTAQLEFRKQRLGTDAQLQAELAVRQGLLAQQEQLRTSGDEAAIAANQAALERSNAAIQALFEPAQPTPLTGKYLRDAGPQPTQAGGWEVVLRFDAKGGEIFADLTKELAGTGRTLGVFLDNVLLTAPVVGPEFAETGITGGSAVITGNFDAQRANELGIQLRGGALPLPVEVVENRTVGATLGRDSVQSSIYAGVGGLILVLIFMVAYYRLPGAIADLALVLYALFTFAAFKLLGVTLTLPGIAGFILSIGMAVDANVLIFERTREELRAGKTLYRSVESGFYRAFSSILDSNVTTLIACAALFWLGSGLVRGFALTLALGVGVSMFTALTCSRTFLLTAISLPELRKPELFCPNLPKS